MLHLPPMQCYLGGEAKDRFHSKLFIFVDFGGAANTFLIACGARHEPSVEEIAKKLLADPRDSLKNSCHFKNKIFIVPKFTKSLFNMFTFWFFDAKMATS